MGRIESFVPREVDGCAEVDGYGMDICVLSTSTTTTGAGNRSVRRHWNEMQDVLIGKVCSGGLFEKVEIEEAHALRWEVRSLRAKIAEAVRRTAIVRELQIVPRAWQIEMAAGMLEKRDGLCLTKTGDGKTYCFLVAAMYEPSLIFMVVSPLIALMQDQVRAAEACGIKAVALCSQNLQKDPEIALSAAAGQFQLVFVAPELLSMENSAFKRLLASKVFRSRLGGVVIDEAHLCHLWRSFRPDYANIGLLRIHFPQAPFMALSATMPLHIQGFIHTSLRFPPNCRLLKRSVDRPNICYMVCEMKYPVRTFKDLFFLIPRDMRSPSDIIKTMVFLDGLSEACDLASTLIEQIPKRFYDEEPDIVAEYTNGVTSERQSYSMDLFQKGICRILVCTEACGMGIDAADVERVVQWGVTPRVNLSTIVQRMGRAARKSHIQGMGILFHTAHSVITEDKHIMEAQKYRLGVGHPEYSEVQHDIMCYDLGLESPKGHNRADENPRPRKRKRTRHSHTQNTPTITGNPVGGHDKDFPKHCRATLSLINTSGCRRRVILSYFGEAPEMIQANPLCCDNCVDIELCPDLLRLSPPAQPQISEQLPAATRAIASRGPIKAPKVPPAKQQQIYAAIKFKRREIWNSLGGNKRFSPYAAGALMPDKDITLLSMKSISIIIPEHVPRLLGLQSYKHISSAHHQLWAHAFDIISSTLREPCINPETLPPPPTPSSRDPHPHPTALQDITLSTNNITITTHTSTGKVRKLTKSGQPRKVRSNFGKPKKRMIAGTSQPD